MISIGMIDYHEVEPNIKRSNRPIWKGPEKRNSDRYKVKVRRKMQRNAAKEIDESIPNWLFEDSEGPEKFIPKRLFRENLFGVSMVKKLRLDPKF